jgi:molybdenum cofactor synthesis domain-containing protein
MLDPEHALELVLQRTPTLDPEDVALADARGRVLARDVVSRGRMPALPISAVDGYAFRSAGGGGRLSLIGESAAGSPFGGSLSERQSIRIMTGAVVPPDADTVAMLEDCEVEGEQVLVPEGFPSRYNIRQPGDDIAEGVVALPAGMELGAAEIGLAATLGNASLCVFGRPRVALMTTGDELVEVGQEPGPGQVIDSNRWALRAALELAGAEVSMIGAAPDRPGPLAEMVEAALADNQVLVTSGGVSVGSHDLVKPLLASLGEVHLGRVRLKPGKPFTFATLPRGRLAFGLPGFPVSSLITFELFVRPALRKMQGHGRLTRPMLPVRLDYRARGGDRTEYQRVLLRREGSELVASLMGSQSSSRLLSLAGAQALVRVPADRGDLEPGTVAEALILDLP